ncbi:MAG: hypothetical protein GY838_18390 [bacterium]|nr:hypothetical protein [bacterium]
MGLTVNGDVVRLRVLVLAALLLVTLTGIARAGTPLQAIRSDAQGLRLEARDLEPSWRATADGTRFDLSLTGMTTGGPLGGWRVPSAGRWILVPPGTRPRLVVVTEDWRAAGGRRLDYETVPATRPGRDVDSQGFLDVKLEPGSEVPTDLQLARPVREERSRGGRARTGNALVLGEIRTWRGRRIAPVTLVPVRHGADGTVTGVLASGAWEIRFEADEKARTSVDQVRLDTRNDERFAGGFLNSDLLKGLPSEAAFHGVRPAVFDKTAKIQDVVLEAPEVRIGVAATDMLRVTAATLRDRGLLTADVDESQIRLYQRRYVPRLDDGSGDPPYAEIEVPIHMVGEGDAFDGDDFFVFHGLRPRDDTEFTADLGDGLETIPGCGDNGEWSNGTNVYWLAAATPPAGVPWARMATATLAASGGSPLGSYRRVDYREDNEIFRAQIGDRRGDRLYFNNSTDPNVSVGLSSRWYPDPAGAPALFEVGAAAYADSQDAIIRLIDVALQVTDGVDTDLGTMRVGTVTDREFAFPEVPASILLGKSAAMRFTPRTVQMWAFVNWVRLSYDALYKAYDPVTEAGDFRLNFHSGTGTGPRDVEVTGFEDSEIGLFDVSDPRNPIFIDLAAANKVDAGTSWTLSIRPAAGDRAFWAVGDWTNPDPALGVRQINPYLASVAESPVNPLAAATAPDVLVVTHADFRAGLDPWIAHRQARSAEPLNFHVVDVADLYDWYSGGLRDKWAIRRFVRHALNHSGWGSWALVLVGDANENARELAVHPDARSWSRDLVPTHYHVQSDAVQGFHELMASDKWYVTGQTGETDATDDYPARLNQPWEMYVGRLPCNSTTELDRMIDKIIVVETLADGEDWRKRAVIIADDSWSDGYGASGSVLRWNSGDPNFARSQGENDATWSGGSPVALETNLVELSEWLDPLYPDYPPVTYTREPDDVQADTRSVATPRLLSALSGGGMFAHYQGHANIWLIASEYWLVDGVKIFGNQDPSRDLARLSNTGRPFVFFGMGCHVGDFAQSPSTDGKFFERSFCEKMLADSRAGAVASYGSPGYEFININAALSETMFDVWLTRPPVSGPGSRGRSRWMLGEMLWAAEAEYLAIHWGSSYSRGAIAQFAVLGDPLMMLDAGPPQVAATLRGSPDETLADEADLTGLDETNLRTVSIHARDEAGIDRLRVTDSLGADLTSQVVAVADSLPTGETDHQEVFYELEVPVRPFAHTLEVEVWDTGAPLASDRHWTLTLNVGQEVEFTVGGEIVDPDRFAFELDLPVTFTGHVTSAAWLSAGMAMSLEGDNLDLSNVSFDLAEVGKGDKTNAMTVTFTATAPAGSEGERAVDLVLDGHRTTWVLQAGEQSLADVAIGRVYSFPNPLRADARIVFETSAASCRGVIRIFNTAGRTVARLPVIHDGSGTCVVPWDARDAEGDEVANGTYLYRVELAAPDGQIASDVQRLVVMR